jgi:hypothetical protein
MKNNLFYNNFFFDQSLPSNAKSYERRIRSLETQMAKYGKSNFTILIDSGALGANKRN